MNFSFISQVSVSTESTSALFGMRKLEIQEPPNANWLWPVSLMDGNKWSHQLALGLWPLFQINELNGMQIRSWLLQINPRQVARDSMENIGTL